MIFRAKLVAGRLIRRYKRFLADVQLADGVITAACPNTGSMLGCCDPGSRVWLSESDRATRKYRHTWEIVEVGKVMVGINTGYPTLVAEAIAAGASRARASHVAEVGYGESQLRGHPPRKPAAQELRGGEERDRGRREASRSFPIV